ncbi:hypothetical protein A2303_03065 [Candidatus Falkowbacteria bacterium RIFOXYB2_FULL_47_14]|uniref:Uncharacterized protein n=1 Tax=Candidatus Falkowbacteria bacterium RIFOXYA2_FULL_47_19 TaxID=1797994 RepID=A0A1F5SF41_9BACT|nr:MAG: hypothetical protein A2227_07910 [Candidatus Falkowbacteria bacterium RIFOXYA2_FULL_47_19]OGF35169.1 MAG: hypothetical protein A2468_01900 [Candidatus Falkowbacteria bacterium RIFOXYC2_FULL_46_15]OGF43334.1 MAG: hypothetical protein A2303_03065 [Candidatus Falkowbacteria bacterium RIFOXYB2_FULL_47_14]
MKKFYFILMLSAVFVVQAASYTLINDEDLSARAETISYLLPPLIAVVCGVFLLRFFNIRHGRGLSLSLIVLGLAGWLLGEVLWVLFGILDINQTPSIADLFYIIAYPLMAAGFFMEIKRGKVEWTAKKALFLLPLLAIGFYFTIVYGIIGAYDAEASIFENMINMFYGVGDTILGLLVAIILMIIWEYRGGKIFFPWLYIFMGVILTLIPDILYAVYFDAYMEGLSPYRYLDLVWGLSYLFFAYGFFALGQLVKDIQNRISVPPPAEE